MILEKISFDEAFKISPWPARLLGVKPWSKTHRDPAVILEEYETGWYAKALALWQDHHKHDKNPLGFCDALQDMILRSILDNQSVYGVYDDKHLISMNKQLYVSNWLTVSALYDHLLQETLGAMIKELNVSTLVELGCGTGANLFKLYERNGLTKIIGGDICPSAIKLGNDIATQCHMNAQFSVFDYYKSDDIRRILETIDGNYIIFTSHSIEQIQVKDTSFVEQINNLPKKPERVVHFEPMLVEDKESFFGTLCDVYATINCYNLDLLDVLTSFEQKNDIEIMDYQNAIYGISAFNPTSVISWKPRK